jgi:hypothetical protein
VFSGGFGLLWLYFALSSLADGEYVAALPCLVVCAVSGIVVIRELRLRLLVGCDGSYVCRPDRLGAGHLA